MICVEVSAFTNCAHAIEFSTCICKKFFFLFVIP